ncbi:MAG: carboxymuconolactone decarboxylase family protein [Polyangiaceae bacterium]
MIRLDVVRRGHGLKHKLMLGLGRLVIGADPPDILRVLFHRHDLWGKPVGVLTDAVLRGPSEWSVGERELFATYVSAKNACRFCTVAHQGIAGQALGKELVDRVVATGDAPGLSDKARVALPFVEKLTLEPERVTAADLEPLRRAGISNDAIVDLAYVVMLFCMYNRIVDAMGCEPVPPDQVAAVAHMLLEKGYDI